MGPTDFLTLAHSHTPHLIHSLPRELLNMNDDDASYSSSSSDDDFLTSVGGSGGGNSGGINDREALVRKKLLESFYGASASTTSPTPAAANNDNVTAQLDDNTTAVGGGDDLKEHSSVNHGDEDGVGRGGTSNQSSNNNIDDNLINETSPNQSSKKILTPSQIPQPFTATKSDLDSPSFNPKSHTISHIAHSSIQTLLETNEHLALDIRTLDSTMQTLVYENYSKFIDATDAIKSIGTNVSSINGNGSSEGGQEGENASGEQDTTDSKNNNNNGLHRLLTGMERIQQSSLKSEQLLHASREAVAEKLRIQRLLTRLDALLSLPTTLRTYISQGKYRMAVSSHVSATEILGRHSAGFESLRSIESECGVILKELVDGLKQKLIRWSGGGGELEGSSYVSSTSTTTITSSLPPKSIAEIFECAGTLLLLHPTSFSSGLDKGQCQMLALAACGQFLRERLSESEGGGSMSIEGESSTASRGRQMKGSRGSSSATAAGGVDDKQKGIVLELPISFLDGILEATTLYGVSFLQEKNQLQSSSRSTDDDDDVAGQEYLTKFVTANFDKFISHVHMLLILQSDNGDDNKSSKVVGNNNDEEEESKDDVNFHQVSIALSHLLRSVRELASGLALPEVGLDVSLASTLVDQTVELAEMLVRRRITTKFRQLRSVVVTECLAPLVTEVIEAGDDDDGEDSKEDQSSKTLGEIIQLANVALSDGLQMADDLIRATLQRTQSEGGTASSSSSPSVLAPVDSAVVKLAVQREAKLFGVWLASALEQLVGCEPSFQEDDMLLEVWDEESEEGENEQTTTKRIIIPQLDKEEGDNSELGRRWVDSSRHSSSFLRMDSSAETSKKDETSNLIINLLVQLDDGATERAYSNFLLAICEMCRLAERSMANTLNQSIQSAMKEDARVADSANTLFGDSINPHRKGKDGLDSEQLLSKRFQLAASRALSMYVMNRGAYAASELCTDIYSLSDARDPYAIPSRPREVCLKVFEIAKASCEDCISIVGGDLFVVPVPPFPEEVEYVDVFGDRLTGASGGGGGGTSGASSGLQLDVERMFIEKSQVYPHSLEQLDFTRNSVVSGILRVALSAFLERVRSSVVSSYGYRQLKVDAVFLRYIIPHYVKDEFGTSEQNACSCLFNTIDDVMLKAGQRCFDHEVTNDDDYYDVEKDEIYTPFQIVQRYCESDEQVIKRVSF